MDDVEVSVVIATYRREETLKKALVSLQNQTFKNIEIIIVDDNAEYLWNEKVKKIVTNFCDISFIRTTLIQNGKNMGSAKTRNIGIDHAVGKYITFLDDDDVFLPNKICKQYEAMERNEADYSLCDLKLINSDGSLNEVRTRKYIQTTQKKELLKYHIKYNMTGTDTMMFRKSYLDSIGGFTPIDIGDEFYLMLKAIENNGKFVYLQMCEVEALVHVEGGLSSGPQKIGGENCIYRFKKKYFDRLDYRDRQYVKMRHFAVLAYAYLRMGNRLKFLLCGIQSFCCSPIQCIKLLKERKAK